MLKIRCWIPFNSRILMSYIRKILYNQTLCTIIRNEKCFAQKRKSFNEFGSGRNLIFRNLFQFSTLKPLAALDDRTTRPDYVHNAIRLTRYLLFLFSENQTSNPKLFFFNFSLNQAPNPNFFLIFLWTEPRNPTFFKRFGSPIEREIFFVAVCCFCFSSFLAVLSSLFYWT